jgi:hypothetical protein
MQISGIKLLWGLTMFLVLAIIVTSYLNGMF